MIIQAAHIGTAPFETVFEAIEEMVTLVRWNWTFGDGETSTDKDPRHIYKMPGVYTVTCQAWDDTGTEYLAQEIEYVFVYDRASNLFVGANDFCIRVGIKPSQGMGVMPVDGVWVWPNQFAASLNYVDDDNKIVTLVIDSKTMQLIQVGIPEVWTDREGGYDEAEIECEAMLPEITPKRGPQENVRHVETHVSMRPYDERDYRGRDGYDGDGFKNGNELSLEIFSSGEQITPATKLESLNRDGDYAFLKEVEAKRFQLKLKHTTSGFRVTNVVVHYQEIDHRTPPQLNATPELGWQRELSLPDLWISRKNIGTNRADGSLWTGTYTVISGPDGKTASGFSGAGFTGTLAYAVGNFTISGWTIGAGTIFSGRVSPSGTVQIYVSGGMLVFNDGVNIVNHALISNSGWRHIAIIRRGTTLEVYEAGNLVAVYDVSVRSIGGACTVAVGACFDIRRHTTAVSSNAIRYYYDSVLTGGGGVLP